MPSKKSDLHNARSRDARRQRAKRDHQSAEQIAARNAAQRIRTAERRARESQEQRDERLRQAITRTKAARKQNIARARVQERQRQWTSRSLTRALTWINKEIEKKVECQSHDNVISTSADSTAYLTKQEDEDPLEAEVPLTQSESSTTEQMMPVVKKEVDPLNDELISMSEIDTKMYDQPLVSSCRSPMQFSVKVEVEVCDESHDNYAAPMNDIDNRISNIVESSGVVTVDVATSNIFKPTIKPRLSIREKQTPCINTYVDIQAENDTNHKFTEYVTNRPTILRVSERLIRSNKTADRILAKEARNYVGRVFDEPKLDMKDRVLQNVFKEWKQWHEKNMAIRESPLLYKCYSCGLSWWHLYEFKEHISRHLRTINFQLDIEEENDECYVVYIKCNPFKKIIKFPLSDCHKCCKPAKDHVFANKQPYKCSGCNESFFTCYQLSLHEMQCVKYKYLHITKEESELLECDICKCGFYTESTLYRHLKTTHMVRSDTVMPWDVHQCKMCMKTFILASLHTCEKRTNNYGCNYCGRSFQKKIYKEIHVKNYHEKAQCRLCDKQLMAICMEPSHMLQHTQKFALMYKCIECSEGGYYPDEFSIKHHTVTIHNRPFEKKFKYLEMVILPKQCLDKSVKSSSVTNDEGPDSHSVSSGSAHRLHEMGVAKRIIVVTPKKYLSDSQKLAQVVAETIPIMNQSVFRKSSQKSTREPKFLTKVVVKEEPMDCYADATEALCLSDLSDVKVETKSQLTSAIQISSVRSLRDLITVQPVEPVNDVAPAVEVGCRENATSEEEAASAEDVIIVEKEADVISVHSSDESCDSSNSEAPLRKKYTGVVRKHLTKYVCRCGFVGVNRKIKKHKKKCAAILAMRVARKKNVVTTDKTEPEDNGNKTSKASNESEENTAEDGADSDEDNTMESEENNGDHNDSDGNWSESNEDGRRKRRKIIKYACKCNNFRANYLEYKLHREECTAKGQGRSLEVTCTKCSTTFQTFLRYANHFHKLHGYERNACPQCFQTFDNLGHMSSHLMIHVKKQYLKIRTIRQTMQGTKCNTCKDCYETFEPKDYLKHWETHLELKVKSEPVEVGKPMPIMVDFDEKMESLYSPEVLKKAITSLQSAEAARGRAGAGRRCVVCAREFARVNDCKRHTVEHLLADAFVRKPACRALLCQLCGADFLRADRYKHHMREHASLPLYHCELCSKSFSDSSNFSKHKKVHNLSVYRCHICDKKFHNEQFLEKHMELHETMKPLVCEQCERVFYSESALKKHVRYVHEKHRVCFYCPICRCKFMRLRDKWEHLWQVHRERKYPADCPLCARQFRRFADLKVHVRAAHGRGLQRVAHGPPRLVCARPCAERCACCPPPAGTLAH